jgi:hypothetical protein
MAQDRESFDITQDCESFDITQDCESFDITQDCELVERPVEWQMTSRWWIRVGFMDHLTRIILRSMTFVLVGPVTSRSPVCLK